MGGGRSSRSSKAKEVGRCIYLIYQCSACEGQPLNWYGCIMVYQESGWDGKKGTVTVSPLNHRSTCSVKHFILCEYHSYKNAVT